MIQKGKNLFSRHGITVRIVLFFVLLVILPFLLLSVLVGKAFLSYAVNTLGEATMDTMSMAGYQIGSRIADYEEQSMFLYYDGYVELIKEGSLLTEEEQETLAAALSGCCFPTVASTPLIL